MYMYGIGRGMIFPRKGGRKQRCPIWHGSSSDRHQFTYNRRSPWAPPPFPTIGEVNERKEERSGEKSDSAIPKTKAKRSAADSGEKVGSFSRPAN